jgi:hypothetical protein
MTLDQLFALVRQYPVQTFVMVVAMVIAVALIDANRRIRRKKKAMTPEERALLEVRTRAEYEQTTDIRTNRDWGGYT